MPLIADPLLAWNLLSDAPDLMILTVMALVVASSQKVPLLPPFGQALGRFRNAGDHPQDPHASVNRLLTVVFVISAVFLGICIAMRITAMR